MKMKEKDEKSRIELLGLVEDSNATRILTDENLKQGLNDLMKYELIDIRDEKICITERGKRAQREGINAVIANLKKPKPYKQNKSEVVKPNYFIKYLGLLMLVLLIFVGLFFISGVD